MAEAGEQAAGRTSLLRAGGSRGPRQRWFWDMKKVNGLGKEF